MGRQETEKMRASDNPYAYTVQQNLRDAGCTEKMVEEFMALQAQKEEEGQIRLLSGHRKHLLENLHRKERQIECLDYLLYQMQNRDK